MLKKVIENERSIIYLSLFVIIVLVILLGLSNDQIYSSVVVFLIVIVILGNVIYFYGRMRLRPEEKGGFGFLGIRLWPHTHPKKRAHIFLKRKIYCIRS